MYNYFLVHITLPDVFNESFYRLIPEQRMVINHLMEERIVKSYSLDMERKNVWVYVQAKDEQAVMDVISTFPIIKYVKIAIHELAFYDVAQVAPPELIMN